MEEEEEAADEEWFFFTALMIYLCLTDRLAQQKSNAKKLEDVRSCRSPFTPFISHSDFSGTIK